MSNLSDEQMRATTRPSVLAQIDLLRENDKRRHARKFFRSWIEGGAAAIADFDSAVSACGLERVYWREHKIGWRGVRLVFELAGPADKVDSFVDAANAWVKQAKRL